MKHTRLMMVLICFLSVGLLIPCFGRLVQTVQTEDNPKNHLNPTRDENSPTGIYIPRDLPDAFRELEKMLHPDLIADMKSGTEDDMIHYHFGLGMWLRNNWGLWAGSRLSDYFNKLGVFHPDDMSGIIFDSFWRHLNHKPIELEQQVKGYQDFWQKQKEQEEKEEKVP